MPSPTLGRGSTPTPLGGCHLVPFPDCFSKTFCCNFDGLYQSLPAANAERHGQGALSRRPHFSLQEPGSMRSRLRAGSLVRVHFLAGRLLAVAHRGAPPSGPHPTASPPPPTPLLRASTHEFGGCKHWVPDVGVRHHHQTPTTCRPGPGPARVGRSPVAPPPGR